VEADKNKTAFATEWGSYTYNVMPFGFQNVLAVLSWIVVVDFREYIHKLL